VDFQISSLEEDIMAIGPFLKGAFLMLLTLIMVFISVSLTPVYAGEKDDTAVRNALLNRTNTFCKAVLPAWFNSENGVQDPNVRDLVTDCYMGQARLSILGVNTNFPLEEVSLREVPAVLIKQETGMSLDIFTPLAGRTIRSIPPENGN
jgi:hypothetical protein